MLLSNFLTVAAPPCIATVRSAAKRPQQKPNSKSKTQKKNQSKKTSGSDTKTTATTLGFTGERKDPVWQCAKACGACCKLDKGPTFPSPEEVFNDPCDVQLYKSLIGPEGWCIHFEKSTRTCLIYSDRPYFCRVEPDIFEELYGIEKKKFNKEACSCCIDTIKAVYGSQSKELDNFNHAIRNKNVV